MWYYLWVGCLVTGMVLLLLAVLLSVVWHVPDMMDELSGRKAKRQIKKLKELNTGTGILETFSMNTEDFYHAIGSGSLVQEEIPIEYSNIGKTSIKQSVVSPEEPTGYLNVGQQGINSEEPTGYLGENVEEEPTEYLNNIDTSSEEPTGYLEGNSEEPTNSIEEEEPTGYLGNQTEEEIPTGFLESEESTGFLDSEIMKDVSASAMQKRVVFVLQEETSLEI